MKRLITLFFLLIILFTNTPVKAETNNNLVNIYFFHSNTCNHCQEENQFLTNLEKRYSNIKIYKYEIHQEKNQELLKKVEELYNTKINSVPLTIIGNSIYNGFTEKNKITFIKTIEYFSWYGYEDPLGKYLNLELPTYPLSKNSITLNNFLDNYHNYNILGLKTDDLELTNTALLLGALLSLNIIYIISLLLAALISTKIKSPQNKIKALILYISLTILLLLKSIINIKIISIIIYILIMLFIIALLIKYQKDNLYIISVSLITIIANLLITNYSQNILIFKNLQNLYNPTGFNNIYYHLNYIIIFTTITILLSLIIYNLISKKKIKYR